MRARFPPGRVWFQIGFGVVALLFSTTARAGLGVWTTSGPLQGGYVVVTDQQTPGVLYVSASSNTLPILNIAQLYKSTDDGATWSAVGNQSCQAAQVVPLATAPSSTVYFSARYYHAYEADRTEVLVSTDGGATCTALAPGAEPFSAYTLAVDAVNRKELFVSVRGNAQTTLSRSLDGGATWTRIDSDLALGTTYGTNVVTDPSLSGTVYVVTGPNLFKSVDSGAAWVSLARATSPIFVVTVDPTNSSVVYVGGARGLLESGAGAVAKSRDGGVTFADASAGLPDGPVRALCVNPRNPDQVFAAMGEGVFATLDGGASWQAMNSGLTNLEVISLAIDSTGDFIHAATVSGVFDFQLAPPTCAKDAHTLCLNGGRFSVSASFSEAPGALPVQATAVSLTNDTGYFWFFDPANVEMVVKVLTGCSVNGKYWVFAGGLTNVGVEWNVTDTLTGSSQSYSNAAGTPFQPIQDSSVFPCP